MSATTSSPKRSGGRKKLAEKFQRINKAVVRGKAKHTRTGACTAKGKCFHGKRSS